VFKKSLSVPLYTRGEPLTETTYLFVYQRENWISVLDINTGKTSNFALANCPKPVQAVVARSDGLVAVMCHINGHTYIQEGNLYAMPDTYYTWTNLDCQCNSLNAAHNQTIYVNCPSSGAYTASRNTYWYSFGKQKNFADFHLVIS